MESVYAVLEQVPHFAIALLLLGLGKKLLDWTSGFAVDDELTEKDNRAVGVAAWGYLLGVAIALSGAFTGTVGVGVGESLLTLVVDGAVAVGLVRLSLLVNDKLILRRFAVRDELVRDQNAGTGFVVAGGAIATGLVIHGALSGTSASWLHALRDIVVYWLAGQLVLIAASLAFARAVPYDLHRVIGEEDNVAAGISFGGFLAALGLVVRAAIAGAGVDLLAELAHTAIVAVVGVVLLLATRVFADWFFLPRSPLAKEVVQDRNTAAGAVAAASFLSVAALLHAALTAGV